MKPYPIDFSPGAAADVDEIWGFVAQHAGRDIADGFIEKIRQACDSLEYAPARGVQRIYQGRTVRCIGAVDGRVSLIFQVDTSAVTILAVYYAGRDHGTI